MVRSIAGVVIGYIVMFVVVMATFTGAYFVLGAERSFKPGSYEVTGIWIAVSTLLSFVAAVLGGMAAVKIGKSTRTASLLAIIVVVLGVILALPTLDAPEPGEPRTGEVGNFEAMMQAQQPTVVSFLNPVIGVLGVLVGGRMRKTATSS